MLYINNSLQNNDKIVMLYNDMITEQLQFAKDSKKILFKFQKYITRTRTNT